MTHVTSLVATLFALFIVLSHFETNARYLPTRANGDRLDKLRELMKDLLESELDKEESVAEAPRWRPESKYFAKREANFEKVPLEVST